MDFEQSVSILRKCDIVYSKISESVFLAYFNDLVEFDKSVGILYEQVNSSPNYSKKYTQEDYDNFLINHPILGNCLDKKKNIYLGYAPFLQNIVRAYKNGAHEPFYTKTMGCFLENDKYACDVFIKTLFECLDFNLPLPDNREYESVWEKGASVSPSDEKNTEENRIDNLITWKKSDKGETYAVCIEIKFGNTKLPNDLDVYFEETVKKTKKENALFVVLSGVEKKEEILSNKKSGKYWKNILWDKFMPVFNNNLIRDENVSEDFKRYVASLWRKTRE